MIKDDFDYLKALEYVKKSPILPLWIKDTIISALTLQIPVDKHKYQGIRCKCGMEVAKNQRYCEYCGQKLNDWSED